MMTGKQAAILAQLKANKKQENRRIIFENKMKIAITGSVMLFAISWFSSILAFGSPFKRYEFKGSEVALLEPGTPAYEKVVAEQKKDEEVEAEIKRIADKKAKEKADLQEPYITERLKREAEQASFCYTLNQAGTFQCTNDGGYLTLYLDRETSIGWHDSTSFNKREMFNLVLNRWKSIGGSCAEIVDSNGTTVAKYSVLSDWVL